MCDVKAKISIDCTSATSKEISMITTAVSVRRLALKRKPQVFFSTPYFIHNFHPFSLYHVIRVVQYSPERRDAPLCPISGSIKNHWETAAWQTNTYGGCKVKSVPLYAPVAPGSPPPTSPSSLPALGSDYFKPSFVPRTHVCRHVGASRASDSSAEPASTWIQTDGLDVFERFHRHLISVVPRLRTMKGFHHDAVFLCRSQEWESSRALLKSTVVVGNKPRGKATFPPSLSTAVGFALSQQWVCMRDHSLRQAAAGDNQETTFDLCLFTQQHYRYSIQYRFL